MAKKAVTIEDVKKAKIKLEKSMLDLAKAFEEEYKVKVSYIGIDRKDDEDVPSTREKTGPIVDVSVNMDLDLIL